MLILRNLESCKNVWIVFIFTIFILFPVFPVVVVQSLNCAQFFGTLWSVACKAPLTSTISQSLLKFMSTESMMLSNHLLSAAPFSFCCQSFSASRSSPMHWLFPSGGQSIGASGSASVPQINSQCWFPLGLASLIPLLSKGLSRVFFSSTIQKHQVFSAQSSLWSNSHIHT